MATRGRPSKAKSEITTGEQIKKIVDEIHNTQVNPATRIEKLRQEKELLEVEKARLEQENELAELEAEIEKLKKRKRRP